MDYKLPFQARRQAVSLGKSWREVAIVRGIPTANFVTVVVGKAVPAAIVLIVVVSVFVSPVAFVVMVVAILVVIVMIGVSHAT